MANIHSAIKIDVREPKSSSNKNVTSSIVPQSTKPVEWNTTSQVKVRLIEAAGKHLTELQQSR